ncbi:fimbrial protein StkG [Enterobacter hormaechei]|uniref:fimbrial protein n=3 Tax=Enterobacter TaxID=547 RepID=UPI000799E5AC|nr:fimbrial protein [Enterobacter hormaechei]SAE60382.1 fimbrial protein StkG [Enterobacter hormaechei]
MFETNIPGIYYSVRVHTAESDGGMGGYFAMNTTDWTTVASSGNSDPWDEKWINTSVQIYIDAGYRGNPNKETSIRPKPGTLGKMAIGNPNDSNNQPWTFVVNEDSFQIPIVLPTCDMAMLSDGTNNVNLGEYYVSDIKNNRVKDIPFSISLSNCTSVANITTKLTTSKLTGKNNDLLGNTLSSGAEGAGVKIMYNGTSQLLPNNPDSSYVITDYQTPESKQINYVAQLVANGSTVKPGSFKATGVFTLSYD